jgi:MIP family channel proteins
LSLSLSRRAMAELFGTFLLVFFGCGAVIMDPFPGAGYHLFGIAVVHGIILALAVSMTMAISGGVVNPALTIGLWSIGKLKSSDAGVYFLAQVVGGAIAGVLLKMVMPANVGALRSIAYGLPTVYSLLTPGHAIVIEAILTFVLMSAVMGTVVSAKAPKIAGFGVGLTLIPAIMIGGPLTGAALNPARAFGPAIASGDWTSQGVWWVGPIIGAVLAAQLWGRFLLKEE